MGAGNNFLSNRQQIIARTNDNPLHYHAWMSWLLISEFHVRISFLPLKNLKYLFPVKTKSCTCCSGYPSGYPNSVRWITIGLDNGLFSVWYEAITWTNADILLIGPYGTNFSIFFPKQTNFLLRKCIWKVICRMLTILFKSVDSLRLNDTYSDDGLSSDQCQAIIWISVEILLIGPLGTNSRVEVKFILFQSRCIWNCCLHNVGHFVSASMC